MDFGTAIRTCFQKYAAFDGRAGRAEFWYFWLFLLLGSLIAAGLDAAIRGSGVLSALFSLATILPQLAVTARRLHDTGRSGWWQAAYLVPAAVLGFASASEATLLTALSGIALLVLLVLLLLWLIRRGDAGPNRFGPDPVGSFGITGGRA
jgi:uncharacterized membrane protein YhaH (DUF805 family)